MGWNGAKTDSSHAGLGKAQLPSCAPAGIRGLKPELANAGKPSEAGHDAAGIT